MKKHISIIALSAVMVSPVLMAQSPEGGLMGDSAEQSAGEASGKHRKPTSEQRKERMGRMSKHLDLSDAQKEQMREIRENGGSREEAQAVLTDEQRAKMDKTRARKGAEKLELSDDQQEQMREIRDNGGSREDMRLVLTDDQQAQMAEMRSRYGGKHARGAGGQSQPEAATEE